MTGNKQEQIEFAFQVESNSSNEWSRQLDGPHFAENWQAMMSQAYQTNAWYKKFDRKITHIRYKRPEDKTVQSWPMT